MQEFTSGATRSNTSNKPDYEGYLSPAVIKRFGEFMLKHQLQEDGILRASDNWQKGIPLASYMKSMKRHFIDAWGIHRGTWDVTTDGDGIEDALCAVMFNAMGYLHETLKTRKPITDPARLLGPGVVEPEPGVWRAAEYTGYDPVQYCVRRRKQANREGDEFLNRQGNIRQHGGKVHDQHFLYTSLTLAQTALDAYNAKQTKTVTPIDIIYLDVDGVLADFVGGVMREFALEYDYDNWTYGKGNWNWYKKLSLTFKQVDAVCDADFWAGLKWMHDGLAIHIMVKSLDVRCHLLTTPMKNPESTTGKLTWIGDQIGNTSRKNAIVTAAPKSIFARPGALLIDDRDKNVEEFRAAGGAAILVPRPWNKDWEYANESVIHVKEALKGCGLCD